MPPKQVAADTKPFHILGVVFHAPVFAFGINVRELQAVAFSALQAPIPVPLGNEIAQEAVQRFILAWGDFHASKIAHDPQT